MSAIFGIVTITDEPVNSAVLDKLCADLAHYGPDGSHIWRAQRVGLGHRMLQVTPESLNEQLPSAPADYLGARGRSLQITADCRLDNRAELCQRLAVPAAEWSTIPDSQLLLAAYLEWGKGCPDHLLGDFAFAIWDGDQQTLFCARDGMGVRAFYYAHTAEQLLFASDQDALLKALAAPPTVNDPYLKALLLHNFFTHPAQTLWREVLKLPPGHWLTLTAQGLHVQCYWQPEPKPTLQLPNDRAYIEMAVDVIQQAIDCRLRSAFPIGSHLSGGMDSSAVTVLAARRLRSRGQGLTAFSWSPPVGEEGYRPNDERRMIEAVCTQEGLTCHYAQASVAERLQIYEQNLNLLARFAIAPTLENAKVAQQEQIRVMLSGWGGDETLSFGSRGYLLELVHTGQWRTLWHELPRRAQTKGVHPARLLFGLLRTYWLPRPLRRRPKPEGQRPALDARYFEPAFLARMNQVTPLAQPLPVPDWGQAAFQQAILSNGHLTSRLVAWNALTAAYQIEWRHPMLDRRVIELSLALPPRLYHTNGQPRYLFYQAMAGILPPLMLQRNNKEEPARNAYTKRTGRQAQLPYVTAKQAASFHLQTPLLTPQARQLMMEWAANSAAEKPKTFLHGQFLDAVQCESLIEQWQVGGVRT